jgi:hypothetical protein
LRGFTRGDRSATLKQLQNGTLFLNKFQAHVHGALAGNKGAVHGGNLRRDALVHCTPSVDQLMEKGQRSATGKVKFQHENPQLNVLLQTFGPKQTFKASTTAASCASRPASKLPSSRCATPLPSTKV